MLIQARTARWIKRLRLVAYGGIGLAVVYFVLRFDIVRIPEDSLSPLIGYEPGERLVVDRWVGTLAEGDVVLFEGNPSEILLGRVGRPPSSAPAATWEAIEGGALWIEGDRSQGPVRDSHVLGPIPPERVRGRVGFTFGG